MNYDQWKLRSDLDDQPTEEEAYEPDNDEPEYDEQSAHAQDQERNR